MQNMMKNIDPQTMQNMMKNIDPQMIQNIMKNVNPDILAGMMGNMSQSTQDNSSENIEDDVPRKFKNGQKIIISNLKNDKFNGKEGIVKYYDNEKQRYVIMLDESSSPISIKEENCREVIEIVD